MEKQDCAAADALGLGRADVVLAEHLQHRGAGDAGDQRDIHPAQRDRRQHQVVEPRSETAGDWRVALHREPFELQREHIRQHVAHDEHGDREPEHGENHDDPVDPGAVVPGRQHAHWDRYADGQDQCQNHQRDRRLQPLPNHAGDRQVGEDRHAEVTAHHVPGPFAEADQERAVEAQPGADTFHVRRRRLVAGDDGGRVSRCEIQQAEHEQRHDRHDRDRREHPPDEVAEHQVFWTPQNTGNGALTMPLTFLRQAW